jgi:hypothetical protein
MDPGTPTLVPSASADASPSVTSGFDVPRSPAPSNGEFCTFHEEFILGVSGEADAGVDGSASATCRVTLPFVPLDADSIPPPEHLRLSVVMPDSNDVEYLLYVADGGSSCALGGWYAEDSSWPSELLLCSMTCDALVVIGAVRAEARDSRCVEPRF